MSMIRNAPASKFKIIPIGQDADTFVLQCDGLRCDPSSVTFHNGPPDFAWPTLEQINQAAREHLEREHGFGANGTA